MIKSKRKNPWDELPRGTRNIISLTHDYNPVIMVSILNPIENIIDILLRDHS